MHECQICDEEFQFSKQLFEHQLQCHSDLKISSLFNSIIETETVYSSDSDCDYTFSIEVLRIDKNKRQFYKTLADNRDALHYIEINEVVPVLKKHKPSSNTEAEVLGNEVIIETITEGVEVDETGVEDANIVEVEEIQDETVEYNTDYEQVSVIEPGEIVMPTSTDRIKKDQELRQRLIDLRKKVPDPFTYCDECNKRFTSEKLMSLHKKLYHLPPDGFVQMDLSDLQEMVCPICERYQTTNRFNFKMHLKLTHNHAVANEPLGTNRNTRPRLLHARMQPSQMAILQNITSEFWCEQCSRNFATLKQLETHLLQHENARRYVCDTCGASFNVPEYLKIHYTLHVDIKCGICLEDFVFRKDYIAHHSSNHAGLQKVCIINGELANPNQVPGRTKVPKTGEEYNCTDCGKSFYSRKGYQKHKCKGTDNYPCRIGDCTFVAESLEELKQHKHRELTLTPKESLKPKIEFVEATCPSCNRTYKSKKGFEMHKCKGDRTVKCPFPSCGLECFNIGDYYDHVEEVHKGEVKRKPQQSPDLNDCIEEEEV